MKKSLLIIVCFAVVILAGIITVTIKNRNRLLEPVPQLVTSQNRNMIGKINKVKADTGYVIKDPEGTIVESEGQTGRPEMKNNLICTYYDEDFEPSAITNIETTKEDDIYQIPELMFFNSNIVIFTQNNVGWNLQKGDQINLSFEKYPSEIENQAIEIGVLYNKALNKGEVLRDLEGTYTYTAEEPGEYYLYMIGGSTESITLKSGEIAVLAQK